MEEIKVQSAGKADEVSIKHLLLKIQSWFRYLLSKWLIILMAGVLGGALGLVAALFSKPK